MDCSVSSYPLVAGSIPAQGMFLFYILFIFVNQGCVFVCVCMPARMSMCTHTHTTFRQTETSLLIYSLLFGLLNSVTSCQSLDSSAGRAVDCSVSSYPLVAGSIPAQGMFLFYILFIFVNQGCVCLCVCVCMRVCACVCACPCARAPHPGKQRHHR